MKMRLMEKSDIKQATNIVERNYSKEYAILAITELKDMFSKSSIKPVYIVAEEKGKIVGFAGYIQSPMGFHIYEIYWVNVDPELQRQGIGKKLITKLITEIKKHKNTDLIILTTSSPLYYESHFGFTTLQLISKKSHHLMSLSLEK